MLPWHEAWSTVRESSVHLGFLVDRSAGPQALGRELLEGSRLPQVGKVGVGACLFEHQELIIRVRYQGGTRC